MPAPSPSPFPPGRLLVRIADLALDAGEALAFVADPGAGATVLFCGMVRDHSEVGDVIGLEYESWEDRGESSLREIGEEILATWPVRAAALLHRTGHLVVGEVSVIVACSAPHRAEAFEAARHGIERVKHDAPIWKKEGLVSGDAHWVMGS